MEIYKSNLQSVAKSIKLYLRGFDILKFSGEAGWKPYYKDLAPAALEFIQ